MDVFIHLDNARLTEWFGIDQLNQFEKKQSEMADKQAEKSELHTDSVKAAAESIGINNLSEDAASLLAEDATYRIKQVTTTTFRSGKGKFRIDELSKSVSLLLLPNILN